MAGDDRTETNCCRKVTEIAEGFARSCSGMRHVVLQFRHVFKNSASWISKLFAFVFIVFDYSSLSSVNKARQKFTRTVITTIQYLLGFTKLLIAAHTNLILAGKCLFDSS